MTTLDALSESEKNRVRITGVKAMQLKDQAGQSLVKVETDAGIYGVGEAGASGPMVRAILDGKTQTRRVVSDSTSQGNLKASELHLEDDKARTARTGAAFVDPGPSPAGFRARSELVPRPPRHARQSS